MGFSAGQVQYLDLIKKDTSKLFNEEVIWGQNSRAQNCSPFSPIHPPTHCLPETVAAWGAMEA